MSHSQLQRAPAAMAARVSLAFALLAAAAVAAVDAERCSGFKYDVDFKHSFRALGTADVVVQSEKMAISEQQMESQAVVDVPIDCFVKGCVGGSRLWARVRYGPCYSKENTLSNIERDSVAYIFVLTRNASSGELQLADGGLFKVKDFAERLSKPTCILNFFNSSRRCPRKKCAAHRFPGEIAKPLSLNITEGWPAAPACPELPPRPSTTQGTTQGTTATTQGTTATTKGTTTTVSSAAPLPTTSRWGATSAGVGEPREARGSSARDSEHRGVMSDAPGMPGPHKGSEDPNSGSWQLMPGRLLAVTSSVPLLLLLPIA